MYHYELQDIIFLIKSLRSPSDNFNIIGYINFASSNTRSGKLIHSKSSSTVHNSIFTLTEQQDFNHLPVIDLSLSISTIKYRLTNYFWSHFNNNFNSERACTLHLLCPCYHCTGAPVSINSKFCLLIYCTIQQLAKSAH